MEDNVRQYVAKHSMVLNTFLEKRLLKWVQSKSRSESSGKLKADWKTLVDIHATSRLAIRVIHPFHKFQARHERDFYNQARVYPWENTFQ